MGDVGVRTHLLRWNGRAFPLLPSSSTSSSEHCTSRWMWLGEEEPAEEPGES